MSKKDFSNYCFGNYNIQYITKIILKTETSFFGPKHKINRMHGKIHCIFKKNVGTEEFLKPSGCKIGKPNKMAGKANTNILLFGPFAGFYDVICIVTFPSLCGANVH